MRWIWWDDTYITQTKRTFDALCGEFLVIFGGTHFRGLQNVQVEMAEATRLRMPVHFNNFTDTYHPHTNVDKQVQKKITKFNKLNPVKSVPPCIGSRHFFLRRVP